MLSKNFTFHEAMKDSPSFRYELGQNERYFDKLQKRMEEMLKAIDSVIEEGQNYIASLYNVTISLNRLWTDLQIDESKDKTAFDTYRHISDSLSQIVYLNKSLIEHAYPSLRTGFESFLKREMEKLAEVKSHFKNLSSSLSEALSKKAAINKSKTQELQDAGNSLTAIGTCFSHNGLDYVAQMNIVHALKCPVILETLWAFIKEHGNFFTKGVQFFAEQQEFTVGDSLASMRTAYKQIERKMQDRHTFVPKQIFQYPTGIPTDPQCIMEGYLFKRATNAFKTWNRRWFMVKEGKLLYSHKSSDGEPEVPTVMEENLKLCLVRLAPTTVERACCFELVTPTKSHLLQADSESLCNAWMRALQRTIQNLHEDDHGTYVQSRKSFVDNIDGPELSSSSYGKNDEKAENSHDVFSSSPRDNLASTSTTIPLDAKSFDVAEKQNMKSFLNELIAIPGNEKCADCGCDDAKWTSLNLGIIICIECSGVHRSLGVQYSKVRSLRMDTLDLEQRNILLRLGNNIVNSIFLKNQPTSNEAFQDITHFGINKHSERERRESWIRDKYVRKIFAKPAFSTKSHSRSFSSLINPPSEMDKSTSNPLGLRPSLVAIEFSEQEEDKKFTDSKPLINSYGSDSNLMRSARAAVVLGREDSVDVNVADAIASGDVCKIFCWMVQKSFDLNSPLILEDGTFTTPLIFAAENHQTTMVEFLLLNGARINDVDGKSNTALHMASHKGHAIIVYQLLKKNADKTLRNNEGKKALDIAVDLCRADIVTLLRLHDMKEEFESDQNSKMDETVENFIGDLAAKQEHLRKSNSKAK